MLPYLWDLPPSDGFLPVTPGYRSISNQSSQDAHSGAHSSTQTGGTLLCPLALEMSCSKDRDQGVVPNLLPQGNRTPLVNCPTASGLGLPKG